MSLDHTRVRLLGRHGVRDVSLGDYLDGRAAEDAEERALAWIKALRHARVDGQPFRERFRFRDDSLWWFAELYLHKRGVISKFFRYLAAFDALRERDAPDRFEILHGDLLARGAAALAAGERPASAAPAELDRWARRTRVETVTRATAFAWAARLAALRPRRRPGRPDAPVEVAAFVHSAFWRRQDPQEAGSEGYIGPVLDALAARLPAGALHLVGVGPRTSFRGRRWSDRWQEFRDPAGGRLPFAPIEAFATGGRTRESRHLWHARRSIQRALLASPDLREAARVQGRDLWPVVREELAGIALLQFPWSARVMDEAAAALDDLKPARVVTYAEAGGWGRALVLEARRRRIPSIGLQHGFIYRHWLNYLHEPDEMEGSTLNPADRGFPRPDLTLVFDGLAERHLRERGRFPERSIRVTGSPRLDALVRRVNGLDAVRIAAVRRELGGGPDRHLLLVTSKYTQIRPVLGALLQAVAGLDDVCLVIKCHPAEHAEPYERAAAGSPNVRIAGASTDLALLLAAARAVVTVNSTVAVDAMVLSVPSLVIGLPTNLSPLVAAGAMAGATGAGEIAEATRKVLYDEEFRAHLLAGARRLMNSAQIVSDGAAAERSAEAILGSQLITHNS